MDMYNVHTTSAGFCIIFLFQRRRPIVLHSLDIYYPKSQIPMWVRNYSFFKSKCGIRPKKTTDLFKAKEVTFY